MKRAAVLTIMFVYLFSIVGVTATNFYCCGFLRSVNYSLGEIYPAKDKLEDGAEKCCKTTRQIFKVKDNHVVGSGLIIGFKILPAIIAAIPVYNNIHPAEIESHSSFNNHSPPFWRSVPIYILHCRYTI